MQFAPHREPEGAQGVDQYALCCFPENVYTRNRWLLVPLKRRPSGVSPKAEAAILEVMRAMLASAHFSKSKRYPALLQYCVRNTAR